MDNCKDPGMKFAPKLNIFPQIWHASSGNFPSAEALSRLLGFDNF